MNEYSGVEYKEFVIRRFQAGDEISFNDFHMGMFDKPTTPDFWKWKYLDNPAGENSIYIALKDGEIVGQIGALPVYALIDGRKILASQTLDIAIKEEYRPSGLFYKLEAAFTDDLKRKGVAFTYGIAIRITLILSTRKLGFSKVGDISNTIKVLNAQPYLVKRMPRLVATLLALPLTWFLTIKDRVLLNEKSVDVREQTEFSDDMAELFRSAPPARICIDRNVEYLTWRYLDCPVKKYKIFAGYADGRLAGFAVAGTAVRNEIYGTIEEFFVVNNDERVAKALLMAVTKYFKSEGAAGIIGFWIPAHHPLYRFMTASGFIARPVDNYLIARSYSDDAKIDELSVEPNWYYSLGDSDHFLF